MPTDVKVPTLGESITEATIGQWLKAPGDAVALDEPIASLETDKVSVEVPSPVAGTLGRAIVQGRRHRRGRRGARAHRRRRAPLPRLRRRCAGAAAAAPAPRRRRRAAPPPRRRAPADAALRLSPAVRRAVLENHVDPSAIKGSGKDGRLTKDDVLARREEQGRAGAAPRRRAPAPPRTAPLRPPPEHRRRRRTPRRARQDDPHAPDHRHPPQGRAEHRRLAHHLQRRRHVGGDRRARALQGSVREEARHPARLHGLLREGRRARRQGRPVGQCADRGRRDRLSRLSRRLGRGVGAQGARRPGRPQRRRA